MGSYLKKITAYSSLVMFSHSIFSASFAVAAAFFASRGTPGLISFIWIMTAFFGARNFANAVNRIVDKKIDSENPRTASRHIPSGEISVREAILVSMFFLAVFILGAAMLPPICLMLTPLAALLMVFYSYTKRFTWMCHFFLGTACACASAGGWLGITGAFEWQMVPLVFANGAWVTGFDIIYSIQDEEHDRKVKLYSIPAVFGRKTAFASAVLLHLFTLIMLVIEGLIMTNGIIYFTGIAIIGALFIFQHSHTIITSFSKVNFAAYSVSKIVGIILVIAVTADAFFTWRL
ncbi:MAG: 4-hydroxybenzoate octaprenyltransferase [Spirochaetia bacterium]|jgi:4-hydroxybenzoate polyprenyltransferase|nr:4-hydroxybenzoate octaprenyltransferase [Spirochaetia bacterium]